MILLGIDPGTRVTGYALLDCTTSTPQVLDFGCIRPPASSPLPQRYLIIYESLELLINRFKPSCIAIETQYVQKNAQSAIKLGMARGVCLLAGAKHKIEIFEYTPSKAKKAFVGRGAASKQQVQYMAKKLFNLKHIPEDAADAIALAYCHFLHGKAYTHNLK